MAYLTNSVRILRKHRRRILDGEWPTFTGGTLWEWGDNSRGQLCDGTTINKSSPVQIPGSNWSLLSAGGSYWTALKR